MLSFWSKDHPNRPPTAGNESGSRIILKIPSDILLCIFDLNLLDQDDLKNLRLSHSHFQYVTVAQIFKRITIVAEPTAVSLVGGRQRRSLLLQRTSVDDQPFPWNAIERLTVSRGCPSDGNQEDESNVLDNQLRIIDFAMTAMTRLKSLRWHSAGLVHGTSLDPVRWQHIFERALDIHLTICCCANCGIPAKGDAHKLHGNLASTDMMFRNISKLTVTGDWREDDIHSRRESVTVFIANIMARSPSLKSFELLCTITYQDDDFMKPWQTAIFRQILEELTILSGEQYDPGPTGRPTQYSAVPIEELTFLRVSLRRKAFLSAMPRLKRLKVLEPNWPAPVQGVFFNHANGPTVLEEISLESLSREAERYLRSDQVKGKLKGLDLGMQEGRHYDSIPQAELFRCSIPDNRGSLEELHLRSCFTNYTGGWQSPGATSWALSGCTVLRILTISPRGRTTSGHMRSLLDSLYEKTDFLPALEFLNLRECGRIPVAHSSSFLAPQLVTDCQSKTPHLPRRFWCDYRSLEIMPSPEVTVCRLCAEGSQVARLEITTLVEMYRRAMRGNMRSGLVVTVPKVDLNQGYRVWNWNLDVEKGCWAFTEINSKPWH